MHAKTKVFVNTCNICNTHKYEKKRYNIKLSPRPITDKPLDRVHMDIFAIDRTSYLSMVDSFSKHAQMIQMETKNLAHVKNAIAQYVSSFGVPREIVTDHETIFRSIQLKNFLDSVGTALNYASCSESNGQVEKTHSTIIEIINTNKHKFPHLETSALVQLAIALYNCTIHSSTNYTPNEIMFNRNNIANPRDINEAKEIFTEVKKNLEKASKNQLKQNIRKEEPPIINDKESVFVIPNIMKKLDPRATKTNANQITDQTFKNTKNVKCHKNKIKRLKKS